MVKKETPADLSERLRNLPQDQLEQALKYAQERVDTTRASSEVVVAGERKLDSGKNSQVQEIVEASQKLPEGSVDTTILAPGENPGDVHRKMLEALVNGGDPATLTDTLMNQSKN